MSLGGWCKAFQQPYHTLSEWRPAYYVQESIVAAADRRTRAVIIERPTMFAGRLRDGTTLPPNGFACTGDGFLIYQGLTGRDYAPTDDMPGYVKGIDAEGRFLLADIQPARDVTDQCVYFGGQKNFGHFLFQNLLRLAAVDRMPELRKLPIAVHEDLPARYLDFLELLGYPESRRIAIPSNRPTRFSYVWLASSPMYKGPKEETRIWPEAIWWAKAAMARAVSPRTGNRRRIFITRDAGQWRRIVNSTEVMSLLGRYRVDPVDFAAMSAADQVAEAGSAEIIVSVLGAGSAISLFSQPDCVQVELAPPNFLGFFGPIGFAAITGQPHERIVGAVATAQDIAAAGLPPSTSRNIIDADFVVDCRQLAEVLDAAVRYCKRPRPT
jgi:hypothetical protein